MKKSLANWDWRRSQPASNIGRPTNLTQDKIDEFIKVFKATGSIHASAGMIGVNVTSIGLWLQKGQIAKKGVYYSFHLAFLRARAETEATVIGRLRAFATRGGVLTQIPKVKMYQDKKGRQWPTGELDLDENGSVQWVQHYEQISPEESARVGEWILTHQFPEAYKDRIEIDGPKQVNRSDRSVPVADHEAAMRILKDAGHDGFEEPVDAEFHDVTNPALAGPEVRESSALGDKDQQT